MLYPQLLLLYLVWHDDPSGFVDVMRVSLRSCGCGSVFV